MQHGVRSTLIIKQAIASDFGPYTCAIQNEHGVSELRIELEEKSKCFTSDHSHIYLYTSLNSVCFYWGAHLLRCGETAEESLFRNKIHFYSKIINKSHFFSSNKFFFRPTFNILVVISAICSNEKRGFCQ